MCKPKPECLPVTWEGSPERATKWSECTHYLTCLDQAAKKGWPGFTCRFCPTYQREHSAGTPVLDNEAKAIPGADSFDETTTQGHKDRSRRS